MKHAKKTSLILALVLALSLLCGCGKTEAPVQAETPAAELVDGAVLGEGELSFTLEVIGLSGDKRTFTVNTDETTVGAALLSLGVIAGEEGSYGLYVKTVGGETADYDKDGKYWAFYIDGEYATTGVDQTEAEEGAVYTFKVE